MEALRKAAIGALLAGIELETASVVERHEVTVVVFGPTSRHTGTELSDLQERLDMKVSRNSGGCDVSLAADFEESPTKNEHESGPPF